MIFVCRSSRSNKFTVKLDEKWRKLDHRFKNDFNEYFNQKKRRRFRQRQSQTQKRKEIFCIELTSKSDKFCRKTIKIVRISFDSLTFDIDRKR